MHATKFYWNEEAISRMRRQLDPDAIAEKVPSYANQLATRARRQSLAQSGPPGR
jgi:hypothetical protein